MKAALIKTGVAVMVAGILWAFVGVERIVGDHEIGVSWEPFIKQRPSLQLRFENPAQKGLEIDPFEALSPAEQAAFNEFCAIRFGATDAAQCRALIGQRRV
jgi:hypothetical protein